MKRETIYFMATYYKKPAHPYSTASRGFGSDDKNYKYDEQISVARTLKTRDYTLCHVILDMAQKRVIKNSMNPGRSFDELYCYFKEHYPKYINTIDEGLTPGDHSSESQQPATQSQVHE
jgi:hypothetical protein